MSNHAKYYTSSNPLTYSSKFNMPSDGPHCSKLRLTLTSLCFIYRLTRKIYISMVQEYTKAATGESSLDIVRYN